MVNDTELLADNISVKVEALIRSYNSLRSELWVKSSGGLQLDKSFVRAFQNSILDKAFYEAKISKLQHLLALR